MIEIKEACGILKTCNACHSTDNTKLIEFICGTGSKTTICVCKKCALELRIKIDVNIIAE